MKNSPKRNPTVKLGYELYGRRSGGGDDGDVFSFPFFFWHFGLSGLAKYTGVPNTRTRGASAG